MNAKVEDLLGSRARVKVIKALAIHEELTITLLIKTTKLNHVNVSKHLEYLKSIDFVQEKNLVELEYSGTDLKII